MIRRRRGGLRTAAWGVLAAAIATGAAGSPAGDGKPVLSLTDPRGGDRVDVPPPSSVLHVVYFATWCPECVEELPALADLEARWGERDYRLVLVAVNTRQSVERLGKFIESAHPPGRVLFDADGRAEQLMRVESVPTHVLVGPDGAELARGEGLADVRDTLLRLLKAGPPGQP